MNRKRASKLELEKGWVAYGLRSIFVENMVPDIRQIESTSVCNLRCVFCPYERLSRKKEHISLRQLDAFVNTNCGHLAAVGLHHFGEPLLNPKLPDVIRIFSGRGIETTISSNLSYLDERSAASLIASGLTRLIASVDAVQDSTYASIRRGGHLNMVCANLTTLLAAKLARGDGPRIEVQMVVTPENVAETDEFIATWSGVPGVDQVVIRDERTIAGQIQRHDFYRPRPDTRQPCRYLWESVCILADGSVVPCCKDFDGKERLGNIFAGDSLQSIWNGDRMKGLRRMHVEGKWGNSPLCAKCCEWPGHEAMRPHESSTALRKHLTEKSRERTPLVLRRGFAR